MSGENPSSKKGPSVARLAAEVRARDLEYCAADIRVAAALDDRVRGDELVTLEQARKSAENRLEVARRTRSAAAVSTEGE
jgi:hypothetical protein